MRQTILKSDENAQILYLISKHTSQVSAKWFFLWFVICQHSLHLFMVYFSAIFYHSLYSLFTIFVPLRGGSWTTCRGRSILVATRHVRRQASRPVASHHHSQSWMPQHPEWIDEMCLCLVLLTQMFKMLSYKFAKFCKK